MAPEALRLAREADALVPGRALPLVLEGRALSELGSFAEAAAALRAAKERDPHALDDPLALLAWARALAFQGDAGGARDAYRELLPRADMLSLADRGVAYLGAGMLAMAAGPSSLGEAVAILRQARRDSQDLLREASTIVLALALDRAGDVGEAAAVLAEEGVSDPTTVMNDPRVLAAMGRGGDVESRAAAAVALDLLGKHDAARPLWQAYLTSAGGGVWEAHARARSGTKVPHR
jgi:tetratricopeptide (TPR) repeat protein